MPQSFLSGILDVFRRRKSVPFHSSWIFFLKFQTSTSKTLTKFTQKNRVTADSVRIGYFRIVWKYIVFRPHTFGSRISLHRRTQCTGTEYTGSHASSFSSQWVLFLLNIVIIIIFNYRGQSTFPPKGPYGNELKRDRKPSWKNLWKRENVWGYCKRDLSRYVTKINENFVNRIKTQRVTMNENLKMSFNRKVILEQCGNIFFRCCRERIACRIRDGLR